MSQSRGRTQVDTTTMANDLAWQSLRWMWAVKATCALIVCAFAVVPIVAVAQSNLGAVPPHQAIQNATEEVTADSDTYYVIWGDAGIRPLHRGWCVTLNGVDRFTGRSHRIPVFVEQDGSAWRNDAVGRAKYDGGADGLYMPPIVARECRLRGVAR